MPSLLKFLLHRPDYSKAELGDIKEYSNQLSSEYIKQSNAIMRRLDKIESRLNDRFDKIDARLGRLDARLGFIEARLDAMNTKLKQVEWAWVVVVDRLYYGMSLGGGVPL
jgi:tetrahydromethanopterin S-methyltransferase subunit G